MIFFYKFIAFLVLPIMTVGSLKPENF